MSAATHVSARTSSAVRALQWGQHALFTLLLLIAVVSAFLARHTLPWWVLPTAAALCCWYAAGIVVARRWGTPGVGVVWLLGLIGWWLPLAAASTSFRWLAFAIFLLALHLLDIPVALVAVGAITAFVVVLQLRDNPDDLGAQVLGPVLGAVIAVGIAGGYRAVLDESRQRQLLLDELREAHAETEALADELARSQRESGALAERARLARDIHDTLAQGFSSILLLSRAGLAQARQDGAEEHVWAQIETTAAENLTESRRVVHALTPAALTETPLATALRRLVAGLSEQTGIAGQVEVTGDVRAAPTAVEVALLRLAQSALANVRLHSRARRCVVTLGYDDDALTLDVVDDGIGFDPDDVPPSEGGFGLRAMRERVAELGGTIEVESAPGEGCAVAVHVPTREVS